ncbi:MAG TPA: hypothetical protein VFS53_07005 [Gemmatimonadota bacterium]|nr:hypothetical protein [Gemmatimonadota bacterium]
MPAKANIREGLVHAVAALAIVACGGGGGGGDPIGPPAANVVGHYAINHTGTLTGLPPITCPGELDITSQTGTSFSGTITITATEACQEIAGSGMVSGTVTSTGALSFTITITNLEELLEQAGCEIVGGDQTFTGSAGASGIIASRTISLSCVLEGGTLETDFEYTISGPKT